MSIQSVGASTSSSTTITMGQNKEEGDDKSSIGFKQKEGKHMSLFQRLFAPESIETDVSGDSESGSLDSATHFTDMSGSEEEDNDESTAEPSTTSTAIKFDRDLRARHRGACKNMTVRKLYRPYHEFKLIPGVAMHFDSVN